jgi:hypothetical protein
MRQSWSDFGRVRASACLKISIDGVIPTTNHFEFFNGILKRKHLASCLHSGHRVRFDSLIHILITRILSGIFSHRKAQKEYSDWLILRFRHHAGGENLVLINEQHQKERDLQKHVPMCWWETDPQRDAAAREAVVLGRLIISRRDLDTYITACLSCLSSKPPTSGVEPSCYTAELCRSGKACIANSEIPTETLQRSLLCSSRTVALQNASGKMRTLAIEPLTPPGTGCGIVRSRCSEETVNCDRDAPQAELPGYVSKVSY